MWGETKQPAEDPGHIPEGFHIIKHRERGFRRSFSIPLNLHQVFYKHWRLQDASLRNSSGNQQTVSVCCWTETSAVKLFGLKLTFVSCYNTDCTNLLMLKHFEIFLYLISIVCSKKKNLLWRNNVGELLSFLFFVFFELMFMLDHLGWFLLWKCLILFYFLWNDGLYFASFWLWDHTSSLIFFLSVIQQDHYQMWYIKFHCTFINLLQFMWIMS